MEGQEGLDELERYLSVAGILTWGDHLGIDGGHPEKHRVVLAGGVQVLAKPGLDENLERTVRREAAGWQIARHLGFPGLVAGTVLRAVPRLSTSADLVHSAQITWPDGRQWLTPIEQLPAVEVWMASVFDAVVAHADHMNSNWFGVPDPSRGAPHLRLVDTGNAFDIGDGKPHSSFYEHHQGDGLDDHVAFGLQQLVDNCPPQVEQLLGNDEARRTRDRAAQLLSSGKLLIG